MPLKSACFAFRPGELLRLSPTSLPRTSACTNPATTIWLRPSRCLRHLTLASRGSLYEWLWAALMSAMCENNAPPIPQQELAIANFQGVVSRMLREH